MKILDCTLRDGGYYNLWDFSDDLVEDYLISMAESKIEYVELGLRSFPKNTFLGAFAYTTEEYLNNLELPAGPQYGVMLDAKTILSSGYPFKDAVNKLFVEARQSKLDLVRIAAHFYEVEESKEIAQELKRLGYIVGFNLMQAAGKSEAVIREKARAVGSWNCIDVLYFADSLGNMESEEVCRIASIIKDEWSGPLGIHTHDNMRNGLSNTLAAKNTGVEWLDVTVTGMGRGAGNTQTEVLLAELESEGIHYNAKPVYRLVIKRFEKLQKKYGWGTNLLYFLGAKFNVHPTYIQNLLSNKHYGEDEVIGAIDYLSRLDGTQKYDDSIFSKALDFNEKVTEVTGTNQLVNIWRDRDVLVLANGPGVKKYKKSIELYIRTYNPVVISINISSNISSSLIDYYVVSHNAKFLSDSQNYKNLNKPIILPKHRFSDNELENLNNNTLIDYGLEVVENEFVVNETYAKIPYDITVGYLLSVISVSRAKSIFLAGFDGYDKADPRQLEMENLFNMYFELPNMADITSLTPTVYPVDKGSVYAPNI